jgi:endonuclease/exonuclease/phosphatase family metal-dependent hydrolase
VNHHPSKYGGTAVSGPRRRIAVERLRFLVDSAGIAKTIAMGDFNDTPDQEIYEALQPVLRNLALPLHERGEGTIKFQGKWELIDHFYVSEGVGKATMKILRIPFLMVQDKAFSGDKPLRTYSGPRYLGGVSDHCPIWLTLTQ